MQITDLIAWDLTQRWLDGEGSEPVTPEQVGEQFVRIRLRVENGIYRTVT